MKFNGKKVEITPYKVITLIVLTIYSISMLVVLLWGVNTALKAQSEFRVNRVGFPKGWPWEWEWSNLIYVFSNFEVLVNTETVANKVIDFWSMLFYTVWYALGGAVIITMVTCIMAYMTTYFKYRLSNVITAIVVVTMILPIVGAYPSEIQILKTLGLYNTLYGMWIQKAHFLGMYFLVFQATFQSVSKEYSEAAYIDGASELQILVRIMLPIVRNTIFTVILLYFVAFWNDYQTPLMYFPNYPTLAYGLQFVSQYGTNKMSTVPMRLSGAIVILLPILTIFLIFRNRILGNVTMGGVKE